MLSKCYLGVTWGCLGVTPLFYKDLITTTTITTTTTYLLLIENSEITQAAEITQAGKSPKLRNSREITQAEIEPKLRNSKSVTKLRNSQTEPKLKMEDEPGGMQKYVASFWTRLISQP